jgi:hypothetical protein
LKAIQIVLEVLNKNFIDIKKILEKEMKIQNASEKTDFEELKKYLKSGHINDALFLHSNISMLFILAYLKHKKQIDITCLNFREIDIDVRGNISNLKNQNSSIILGEIKSKLSKESLKKSIAQLDLRIALLKNIIEWIKDGLGFAPGMIEEGIIYSLDTPENQKFKKIVDNTFLINIVLL